MKGVLDVTFLLYCRHILGRLKCLATGLDAVMRLSRVPLRHEGALGIARLVVSFSWFFISA